MTTLPPNDLEKLRQCLQAGRRLILHRCAASRALLSGTHVLILLTAAAVLSVAIIYLLDPSMRATAATLAIASTAMALAVAVAAVRGARASRREMALRWTGFWDATAALPQTVTTAQHLIERAQPLSGQPLSPWEAAFVTRALQEIRPLAPAALAPLHPYRGWRLVPALIVLAGCGWWLGGAPVTSRDGAADRPATPGFRIPQPKTPVPAEFRSALRDDVSLPNPAVDSLTTSETRRRAAGAAIAAWSAQARESDRRRWDAATALAAQPQLTEVAEWLRGERDRLPAVERPLTQAANDTLQRVTVELTESGRARLADAGAALERWRAQASGDAESAGEADTTLAPIGAEFLDAQAWGAWLRASTAGTAHFQGAPPGDPGSDRGNGSPSDSPDAPDLRESTEAGTPARAPGSSPLVGTRVGATTDDADPGPPDSRPLTALPPAWQSLLARPEIESRWLPVVRQYLLEQQRLLQRQDESPR